MEFEPLLTTSMLTSRLAHHKHFLLYFKCGKISHQMKQFYAAREFLCVFVLTDWLKEEFTVRLAKMMLDLTMPAPFVFRPLVRHHAQLCDFITVIAWGSQ